MDGNRASTADVHVWLRQTADMDDQAVAAAVERLSDEERARCSRFHFARDRRDYAAAHALLRTALSEVAGRSAETSRATDSVLPPPGSGGPRGPRAPADWRFVTTANGKPVLDEGTSSPLAFNLSHTRGCVAVAVTTGLPVGIDVEALDRRPDVDAVAERFFAPDEARWLGRASGTERHERFFRLWTLKEAYLKATGEGIARSLQAIRFELAEDGTVARFTSPDSGHLRWAFASTVAAPGFVCSVALQGASKLHLALSRI